MGNDWVIFMIALWGPISVFLIFLALEDIAPKIIKRSCCPHPMPSQKGLGYISSTDHRTVYECQRCGKLRKLTRL